MARFLRVAFIVVQLAFAAYLAKHLIQGPDNCQRLVDEGLLTSMEAFFCTRGLEAGHEKHTILVVGLWVAVDLILGVTYAVLRATTTKKESA